MTDRTDATEAISEFLEEAALVYDEYDQGYMDADAALRRLRTGIDDLETAVE
jgi:hypothetical protein